MIALLFALPVFQNCAQQPLEKVIIPPKPYEAPTLKVRSEFCPTAKKGSAGTSKFVFIVDLSASNFGNWKKETVGGRTLSYWDSTQASDINGARFEAIKSFVDTCGTSISDSFAVIGFSASAGALSGSNFSCANVAFTDGSRLKVGLDAFKSRQQQDEAWYKQWAHPNYLKQATPDNLIFRVTSYTSAATCLENLVVNDLNSGTSGDRYNVFFISDGIPEDKLNTGCNISTLTPQQKEACYLDAVSQSMTFVKTAALSKGKQFTLGGIYYGTDSGIPSVLSSLSREGGVPDVTKIDSFDSDQNSICKLVVTQFTTEYRPDSYLITPLTTIRKSGMLQADSDVDGLTDEEEITLGSDPLQSRSMVEGILDGICQRLGGSEKCLAKRQSISCTSSLINNANLSDCDSKVLALDKIPHEGDWGIDSDGDGFIDYLEIIKGLDPAKADLLLDPDGDGLTNKEEIIQGSDPFTPDNNLAHTLINQLTNEFKFDSFDPVCPLGAYATELDRMQVTPLLETPIHGADEHIVLIQVRYSPSNSLEAKKEYFGTYFKVQLQLDGKKETLVPEINQIPYSDLLKWGEVW